MRFDRLAKQISLWRRSRGGNIAIITALCAPLLVGFCGMGGDVAYWFYESRVLQGAADIASYDAGVVLNNKGSSTLITSTATADATTNGWLSSNGKITVNNPPKSGTYNGNNQAVEIILTENLPRYFTAIYSKSTVPIKARAVTYVNDLGGACILALSPNSNQAVNVSGSGDLHAPTCDVVSDSNTTTAINMSGSAKLTAPCIVSVGTAATTSGLTLDSCKTPTNHATAVADPYKNVVAPTASGTCIQLSGKPADIYPGYYCKGLATSWGPITFHPGTYYVSGGNLALNAGTNATGSDVTFFVAKGDTLAISGSATVKFSAPTSNTYSSTCCSGIVFFGDRAATNGNNNISGSSSSYITGAVYFPTELITYSGGTSTGTNCTQLVGYTIVISGTAYFNNNCPNDGMASMNVVDGAPGKVVLSE